VHTPLCIVGIEQPTKPVLFSPSPFSKVQSNVIGTFLLYDFHDKYDHAHKDRERWNILIFFVWFYMEFHWITRYLNYCGLVLKVRSKHFD
jgi:hypothetical protein